MKESKRGAKPKGHVQYKRNINPVFVKDMDNQLKRLKQMEEIIKEVIANKSLFQSYEIKSVSTLGGLGLDSLDKIEAFIELEKRFNIQIPDDVIEEAETVSDVIMIVKQRVVDSIYRVG